MWNKVAKAAGKYKTLGRVCVFILVFCICFSVVSEIFQPMWSPDNNFYSLSGFYEEPRNTIETVFLGASIVRNDINTMRLYENKGICAYNLGTANQPVDVSYWWLVETYKYHSKTLKNVFFDASLLRQDSPDSAYHRGFDRMKFSLNKIKAVLEYTDGDLNEAFSYLFPFVSYHTRWNELETEDFDKLTYDYVDGTRGYMYMAGTYLPDDALETDAPKTLIPNERVEPYDLNEDAVAYFERISQFCKDNGLNLVVIKTPTQNWWSALNLAVAQLAEAQGVEYIDFNYSPYVDEIDYVHPLDSHEGNPRRSKQLSGCNHACAGRRPGRPVQHQSAQR